MLVLVCIAQDVVEVCSSEVIAEVDLPDFELDFDLNFSNVVKAVGAVGAGGM